MPLRPPQIPHWLPRSPRSSHGYCTVSLFSFLICLFPLRFIFVYFSIVRLNIQQIFCWQWSFILSHLWQDRFLADKFREPQDGTNYKKKKNINVKCFPWDYNLGFLFWRQIFSLYLT
jgi:hypothetical protein